MKQVVDNIEAERAVSGWFEEWYLGFIPECDYVSRRVGIKWVKIFMAAPLWLFMPILVIFRLVILLITAVVLIIVTLLDFLLGIY